MSENDEKIMKKLEELAAMPEVKKYWLYVETDENGSSTSLTAHEHDIHFMSRANHSFAHSLRLCSEANRPLEDEDED